MHKAYRCPNCGRDHGEMTEHGAGTKLCPECASPVPKEYPAEEVPVEVVKRRKPAKVAKKRPTRGLPKAKRPEPVKRAVKAFAKKVGKALKGVKPKRRR